MAFAAFSTGKIAANDGGPNTGFWIKDNKVTCVSVLNPETNTDNSFLLFDYSPAIGQALGKPWSIVEKGKCYQIDATGGKIYRIPQVVGNEKQTYSVYSNFSPTDNIKFDKNIDLLHWKYEGIGVSENDFLHFTGLHADNLFPTRYRLDHPVISFSVDDEEYYGAILNNETFGQLSFSYQKLAQELETAIQNCDIRQRVEFQLEIRPSKKGSGENPLYIKSVIWKLADGKNTVWSKSNLDFRDIPTSLGVINTLGCGKTFSEFTQSHRSDYSNIDSLAQQVMTLFPSLSESTITPRDQNDIAIIEAFATGTYNPQPEITSSPQKTAPPTSLEEPTIERKNELTLQSKQPLLQLYFFLPFLAGIGISIYFLHWKKRP